MKDCSQCGKSVIKYHRIYKGEDIAILAMFVCLSCCHAQNVVRFIDFIIRKNKQFVRLVVITNLVSDVVRKGMK